MFLQLFAAQHVETVAHASIAILASAHKILRGLNVNILSIDVHQQELVLMVQFDAREHQLE